MIKRRNEVQKMRSYKSTRKSQRLSNHALIVEWGGLTAGAYGRPAVLALPLIVFGFIALKFI